MHDLHVGARALTGGDRPGSADDILILDGTYTGWRPASDRTIAWLGTRTASSTCDVTIRASAVRPGRSRISGSSRRHADVDRSGVLAHRVPRTPRFRETSRREAPSAVTSAACPVARRPRLRLGEATSTTSRGHRALDPRDGARGIDELSGRDLALADHAIERRGDRRAAGVSAARSSVALASESAATARSRSARATSPRSKAYAPVRESTVASWAAGLRVEQDARASCARSRTRRIALLPPGAVLEEDFLDQALDLRTDLGRLDGLHRAGRHEDPVQAASRRAWTTFTGTGGGPAGAAVVSAPPQPRRTTKGPDPHRGTYPGPGGLGVPRVSADATGSRPLPYLPMANARRRLPTNAPGDFFVDDTCIDCATCRWMAPATFDAADGASRVHRQPADSAATTAALRRSSPVRPARSEPPKHPGLSGV